MARELEAAGRQNSREIARVMRLTVDAIDDLDVSTLERVAERSWLLAPIIKIILETIALTPSDNRAQARDGSTIVLGEDEDVKPLSAAQARAPFTAKLETVGEGDRFYQTLSTTEAAGLLKVSRPTVIRWIEDGKLIALSGAKRGWRIPKAQIRRGKPAPGLVDIVKVMADPELTWQFLVSEQTIDGETLRPLDRLFAGDIDLVVRLAEGYGSDFV